MSENVYVTKIEAARHQLCAAVRFFIHGEDELAVHTVASATARIISDVRAQRGHDEPAENDLLLVYGAVKMHRSGEIPKEIAEDPKAMAFVQDLALRFPTITATSTWEDFRELIEDVSMAPEAVTAYWKERNRIANFLKHADRDSGAHITEGQFDNLHLLMRVVDAYRQLVPNGLGGETYVLMMYAALAGGTRSNLSDNEHKILAIVEADRTNNRSKPDGCEVRLIDGALGGSLQRRPLSPLRMWRWALETERPRETAVTWVAVAA